MGIVIWFKSIVSFTFVLPHGGAALKWFLTYDVRDKTTDDSQLQSHGGKNRGRRWRLEESCFNSACFKRSSFWGVVIYLSQWIIHGLGSNPALNIMYLLRTALTPNLLPNFKFSPEVKLSLHDMINRDTLNHRIMFSSYKRHLFFSPTNISTSMFFRPRYNKSEVILPQAAQSKTNTKCFIWSCAFHWNNKDMEIFISL